MSAATDLAHVRLEVAAGITPDDGALTGRASRALSLATSVGAPVGDALRAAAEAIGDEEERDHEIRVATAQARMVAIGLVCLPAVLVPGLDALLGLPLLAFFLTAAGRVVLSIAGLMLACGALVSWRVVARVGRPSRDAARDEAADLLAAALAAGLPSTQALRVVADLLPADAADLRGAALRAEHGETIVGISLAPRPVSAAAELLWRADHLGVAAGGALRDLARSQRAQARARVRERAEQLPSLLAIPSVLLLLPATVLLIGAPVVAAGLASA